MPSNDGIWYEGDRVWVPRITTDEQHTLIIKDLGSDDDEDPDVLLLFQEIRPVKGSAIKSEVTRQQHHFAKFSELQDVPSKRTKGGALRREVRGMVAVKCQCGCGENTSGGSFRQGHDAKLKSRLRKVMDGRITDDPTYLTPGMAHEELLIRGWLS